MRYSLTEKPILAGHLDTTNPVTIKIVEMKTDTLLTLNTDVCNASVNIPGVFLFDTTNIIQQFDVYTNLMYEMTDGSIKFYGKFVMSGYIDVTLKNTEQQLWEVSS